MPSTLVSRGQSSRSNPGQVIAAGLAIGIIVVSVWIGGKAREVAQDLAIRRQAWTETANQLATVQQQFRLPTSAESAAIIAESSRMGALGVPGHEKVNLIDSVGRLAEACKLSEVRVSPIATSDSAYLAERRIPGNRIEQANYAVTVDFAGGFANAVTFVSSLPPSVSLSRMTAARRAGATRYHLILSVYELDAKPGT